MILIRFHTGFKEAKSEKILVFKSNDSQEDLKVNAIDLQLIHVTDNNIEVFYSLNETNQKVLLRNTLKSVIDSIQGVDYLFQCHRSYIVNLRKVTSINGNSRGYRINFKNHDEDIPVSRSKVGEFNELVSKLTEN
ncbi:LytTR family DNA-binding domain-containing protein [Maribacter halichondriae]|uniref:LytTR family DNA-binding domain-containing protein n=1 Tax=Maribacter halichondriae TaxID=2980554 RepID=UPI002358B1F1|nr:LytTR family DNA-binding domain-containing protein [Maribacter sp. Hal144]